MKKRMIILVTLVMMIVAAACSNNTGNETGASGNAGNMQHDAMNNEGNMAAHSEEPSPTVEPEETDKPAATAEPTPSVEPTPSTEPAETDTPTATEEPAETPEPTVSGSAAPKKYKVEIVDFGFKPEKLEIEAGSIVEFVNLDSVKHTSTGDNDEFDTGLLAKDESKEVTFAEAGEFGYYCQPHPGMKAVIIVK